MNYKKRRELANSIWEYVRSQVEPNIFTADNYELRVALDDFSNASFEKIRFDAEPEPSELTAVMMQLHELKPRFEFEVADWHMAAGTDLVITDIGCKKAYDALPKPHTLKELYQTVYQRFGIGSTAIFHNGDLNTRITEKEFEDWLSFYASMNQMLTNLENRSDKNSTEHL